MFGKLTQQAARLSKGRSAATMKKQRGAIAIEFAALFVVFFAIVYAIIAYSIPLLLILTFKQVSSDAGRAAIKVDPSVAKEQYIQLIGDEINNVVDNKSWLPAEWVTGCTEPKDTSKKWKNVPTTIYAYYAIESLHTGSNRYILQVCLQQKKIIIPSINLLGIQIPKLPEEKIRVQTTIRLEPSIYFSDLDKDK